MSRRVTDAVILMAGSGSRLAATPSKPKPLIEIAGRAIISYALDAFAEAGVQTVHAVIAADNDALLTELPRLVPRNIQLEPIENPQWQKQNGISVLCAAGKVSAPFFLAMGDHLFAPEILRALLSRADFALLNLAIDKKIERILDLADAMKVRTRADRVVEIAKDLPTFDAIDIGLFICPSEIFDYLERAKKSDDCSLADGVRLMAAEDKVRAIDIGEAWWHDVDTPEMLQDAREQMRRRRALTV